MEYILFIGYLVFFAWLVTKTKFFTATGLSKAQLVIFFLLKVIAGIFYGWMGLYYRDVAQMFDTWSYHDNGIIEYRLLITNPGEYFTNIFHVAPEGSMESFFGSENSYWNDLKGNFFIKVLSIMDVFSFGHYNVNVIFYSYLALFGPMAIFRVMTDVFPGRRFVILLATFFVPSFFYWTSGIYKEGLIFAVIGMIIYHMYKAEKERRYTFKRIFYTLTGLILLLLLRNFLIIIIIPAILAWVLANRFPRHGLLCFVAAYTFFGILFFTLRHIDPRLDFPKAVADKQQAFIQIIGNSSIPIKELKPTVVSFLKNSPQALTLSAMRPYPGDIHHLMSLAAALEINLLLLLFILSLIFRRKGSLRSRNVVYFCIFFSFSLLMGIGFSVNNLGAIVRYRSIITPLLVVLIAAQVDWARIYKLLQRYIRNNNNVKESSKIPE